MIDNREKDFNKITSVLRGILCNVRFSELEAFLLHTWDRRWDTRTLFWLLGSLVIAAWLGVAGLRIAFSERYVIQGDARQYSLFFQQVKDQNIFQDDLIARYYNSIIPTGYRLFYSSMNGVGIDPFFLNKVVPLLLAVIMTVYCFAVTLEIFPVPLAGFLTTVLLNQNVWTREDLSNGTPRSFAVPLFVAFLYYFVKKKWIPCTVLCVLQALFFPPTAMVALCVLAFVLVKKTPQRKHNLIFFLVAALLTALVLVPYSERSSEFGPIVTRTEAKNLPGFLPGGRQAFFHSSPWQYWITDSGLFPYGIRPPLIFFSVLLPLLWKWKSELFVNLRALAEVIAASVFMFAVAHLVLFHLYNPSRYTQHTFPVVMAVAAGISLTFLLQTLLKKRRILGWAGVLIGSLILIVQFERTLTYGYGFRIYVKGTEPELYQFLHSRAKNKLVASLSRQTDNLPAFTSCATLVGWEFALPYHSGYFRQFQQRGEAFIQAQYSYDLEEMKKLIRKYGVDFVLLDRNAFELSYFASNRWVQRVFPRAASIAEEKLHQRYEPAIATLTDSCAVWENQRLVLLQSTCILQAEVH